MGHTKIVAISDPHLGQTGADALGQYSLLSTRASGNRVAQFVEGVATFAAGDPVVLLVAGDLLDLSLAYAADAFADLSALLRALGSRVAIDEFVHVVGNHDQHVWSLHSEDKQILAPLREGEAPSSDRAARDEAAYQVTSAKGELHRILQPLVRRSAGPRTRATIAYPSYVRSLGDAQLYVTHGHLFGGLYTELSRLIGDRLAGVPHDRAAATVNQPLIEFVYWLLGEAGEGVGADGLVETIYTDLQKGSLSQVRGLVSHGVEQILPHGVLWRVIGGIERRIVVDAVMAALKKILLSPRSATTASRDRFADLEATRGQLRTWLAAIDWPSDAPTIALYGHTHVWDDYQVPDMSVRAWNLSTWLVEPAHEPPRAGFLTIGAGVPNWVDVEG